MTTNTDPIIAMLHDQQRLYDAFSRSTESRKEAVTRKASDAYNTAFDRLLRTKPKTRAGAAALIKHCLAEDARFPMKGDADDALTLLHTLAKAMPALRD